MNIVSSFNAFILCASTLFLSSCNKLNLTYDEKNNKKEESKTFAASSTVPYTQQLLPYGHYQWDEANAFVDDFEGSQIDTSIWGTDWPWGGRDIKNNDCKAGTMNPSASFYFPDQYTIANVVDDGVVKGVANLKLKRLTGANASTLANFSCPVLMLKEEHRKTKWGRYEIRLKFPVGASRGTWFNFWLGQYKADGSYVWPPEFDVGETLKDVWKTGTGEQMALTHVFYKGSNGQPQNDPHPGNGNPSSNNFVLDWDTGVFVTLTFDLTPTSATFYKNGVYLSELLPSTINTFEPTNLFGLIKYGVVRTSYNNAGLSGCNASTCQNTEISGINLDSFVESSLQVDYVKIIPPKYDANGQIMVNSTP